MFTMFKTLTTLYSLYYAGLLCYSEYVEYQNDKHKLKLLKEKHKYCNNLNCEFCRILK